MFRYVTDFISAFDGESSTGSRLYRALTDESLAYRITPEHRSLGEIAWHNLESIERMLSIAGIDISDLVTLTPPPDSAAGLAQCYELVCECARAAVQEHLTDDRLAAVVPVYGSQWQIGHTLAVLLLHQAHHRGQMTVLMRQAGLRLPAIYGPSADAKR